MNLEYLTIFTTLFGLLFFFYQRTESQKRRTVLLIMIIPLILLRNFAVYRNMESEAWAGLFLAFFLNFMFWVLIGRYNPVGSSDNIKVLGMDD
ncbi:MAG: hypothetical protein D6711_03820, partial [Chloroflexi bacterium]